jgi:uncharacterized delta-60 repeat protein
MKNIASPERVSKSLTIFLRALLLVLALTATASAAVGDLDSTFGNSGTTKLNLIWSSLPNRVAIQADGKIVAIGAGMDNNFAVARLNTSGTVDSSFGTDGIVSTDFGGSEQAHAIVIQPDGKIVAVGNIMRDDLSFVIALARYHSNGTLDMSFGSSGRVITDLNGGISSFQEVNAAALQSDGKIILAGYAPEYQAFLSSFWLARYNSNGTLDNTFGNGGIVRTTFVITLNEHATDIAMQPDGKIVVAGYTTHMDTENYSTLILARYNADGTLDATFGQNGAVLGDKSHGGAYALARQSDGKLVIATNQNQPGSLVARYNLSGVLDTSFANNGWIASGLAYAQAIAIQSQGKIVVVGDADALQLSSPSKVGLARLNSDGTLDTAFGINGKVTGEYADTAMGIAIQSDDKIVISAESTTCCGLTIARHLMSFDMFLPIIKKNSP